MSNFKNNDKQQQSKITSFGFTTQVSKQKEALHNESESLFSKDFDFDDTDDNITISEVSDISWHISHNVPVFHYLGIIKLQSASSNAILEDLDQFIIAKHLPLEKLYHVGSDSVSVNLVISTLLEDSYKGQKTVQWLYESIDQDFLIATHFLANILLQLCHLSLVFQANYVLVLEVTMQVDAIIESITTDFIGTTNIQPTFGTILLRFINQNSISPNNLPLFV
ncbi:16467_t:CDS:2 [Dentiscutata heterogama]|uniref:16467_t:CDS:1 n=1 Tax=Dentiscutata heterogama TaxID=1316150 RepID=A0ACA9N1C9_9GLOM|nr:16467_t:CDS:2 [Dentiscutata heterogama]